MVGGAPVNPLVLSLPSPTLGCGSSGAAEGGVLGRGGGGSQEAPSRMEEVPHLPVILRGIDWMR